MQTSVQKSQKTSGGLGNFYVNDWQENGGRIRRIGTSTLYLVFRHLQRSDWGPARLKKRSQCNESSFRSIAKSQDL